MQRSCIIFAFSKKITTKIGSGLKDNPGGGRSIIVAPHKIRVKKPPDTLK
jgi:hypothetical protein